MNEMKEMLAGRGKQPEERMVVKIFSLLKGICLSVYQFGGLKDLQNCSDDWNESAAVTVCIRGVVGKQMKLRTLIPEST